MRQACLSQTVLATAAPAFQGQWNDAHSDCTSTARRLGNAAGCPPSADGAAAGGGEVGSWGESGGLSTLTRCHTMLRRLLGCFGRRQPAEGHAPWPQAPQGAVEQLLLLLAGAGPGASSQATLARAEAMAASLTAEQLNLCPASSRLPSASLLTVAASSSLDEAMLVKVGVATRRRGQPTAAERSTRSPADPALV